MPQMCGKCARVNPPEASYCYYDGAILAGHSVNGGPINQGSAPFPSQFVFPSGQVCLNFDQLALTCQQDWKVGVDLLKQGFLASFLGGLGRADLALAAQEAARFPDQDRGLDRLLAKLPTQALEAPKLLVEPTEVHLGQIPLGSDRHTELHLTNLGMRLLYGSVVSDCKWITLGEAPGNAQKLFQFGAETIVRVQIRGQHLRAGTKPLEGRLVVESNGGSASVVIRVDVPVKPFAEGVLAGAVSPRQIAEKAKAQPQQAAALFEKGAVAGWFTANGWTYPVQGPSASGLGAVQQFFEALGLAKAPKVEISTLSLSLRGRAGDSLQANLEVKTPEKRPVYAYASCRHSWVSVGRAKLNGRFATITIKVPSVPNRPGETLQANIHVTGNGNQRFIVPLTLSIEGSPFADMVPALAVVDAEPLAAAAPVLAAEPAAIFVEAQAVPASRGRPSQEQPPEAPAGAFSNLAPPLVPGAPLVTAPGLRRSGVVSTPRVQRAPVPLWLHLLPLGVLALALVLVMIRDLVKAPRSAAVVQDGSDLRIGLYFDYTDSKEEEKKLDISQSMTFGLVKIDDPSNPKNFKRLTCKYRGQTNSTVAKINGNDRLFAGATTGRWEKNPFTLKGDLGMEATWNFFEPIQVTQKVQIIPGEPVELTPELAKRFLDTCLVRYQIKNQDKIEHTVGLRFLLDTLIGANDGPTFEVPGLSDLITTQRDFDAARERIPDFILALEHPDIKSPGTVVQLNLRLGDELEAPSRVSLTHWPGNDLKKKYLVPMDNIKDDSAIAIYWAEVKMKPGQVRNLGFTFGLGTISSAEGLIGLSVGGSFAPAGDLTVVALVSDPAQKQTISLNLPKEFSLVDGSAQTQEVPPGKEKLADGRLRPSPVTWRVRSSVAGSFTFEVETSTGKRQKQRVAIKPRLLFQ